MTVVIKLPFPPASLFPNRRNGKHWSATNEVKSMARESAVEATKQAMSGFQDDGKAIPVSIVFVAPDKRRRDIDGCLSAAKAQLDGIADALGVNDFQFKPILLNYIEGDKPGAMLVAIGVQIITTQVIE